MLIIFLLQAKEEKERVKLEYGILSKEERARKKLLHRLEQREREYDETNVECDNSVDNAGPFVDEKIKGKREIIRTEDRSRAILGAGKVMDSNVECPLPSTSHYHHPLSPPFSIQVPPSSPPSPPPILQFSDIADETVAVQSELYDARGALAPIKLCNAVRMFTRTNFS